MSCYPVVKEVAEAILALGQFTQADAYPGSPSMWTREVRDDDGQLVTVRAQVVGDKLNLSLMPTITEANARHGRVSGGVYMEIACRVAEKCNSTIVQASNIGECIENGTRMKLLAEYPETPLQWDKVCLGFQRAILSES